MCEICEDPTVEWELTDRVPAGEEWFCDEEDCQARASWRTRFAYVDGHVCDGHKPEGDLPELRSLQERTGQSGGAYLLAVTNVRCEGSLTAPCTAEASWAHVQVAQAFACEGHAPRATPGARA